jgi:hypothetical protein
MAKHPLSWLKLTAFYLGQRRTLRLRQESRFERAQSMAEEGEDVACRTLRVLTQNSSPGTVDEMCGFGTDSSHIATS